MYKSRFAPQELSTAVNLALNHSKAIYEDDSNGFEAEVHGTFEGGSTTISTFAMDESHGPRGKLNKHSFEMSIVTRLQKKHSATIYR